CGDGASASQISHRCHQYQPIPSTCHYPPMPAPSVAWRLNGGTARDFEENIGGISTWKRS
ncbi:hypothetical protein, partial [Mycobacterium sp. E2733]|uniref:hypothetical protein n=1 Tax=Mycobacterium sp. E2733 TaxID=1834138 RepID=UPI001E45A654